LIQVISSEKILNNFIENLAMYMKPELIFYKYRTNVFVNVYVSLLTCSKQLGRNYKKVQIYVKTLE